MYLYPDCDQQPENSCLSLEDLHGKDNSLVTDKMGIRLFQLRNSTISTKSGESLTSDEVFEEGKLQEPVRISVLLPYTKPKNRKHSHQPEIKEEPSRKLEFFQPSEAKDILQRKTVTGDRVKPGREVNIRKSRRKGPTRPSHVGDIARVGSKILPKPSRAPNFKFTTRYPFPNLRDSKERDSNEESILSQQSREVEVVLPQVIKPIRLAVPTKSQPGREPLIYNAESIASVSFGTKIQSPKAFKEISAKPGYLVDTDFVIGKKVEAEQPPVREQTKRQNARRITRKQLTSYAARAIDFAPIRAALFSEQQKLLQELNIQQRVLSRPKYAKITQSPLVLTTTELSKPPTVITTNNPLEYSARTTDSVSEEYENNPNKEHLIDAKRTSTEAFVTTTTENTTSGMLNSYYHFRIRTFKM